MINYIFVKLLVEIQTSHEKLVKCKTRRKFFFLNYDIEKKKLKWDDVMMH